MTVGELRELLDEYADDQEVVIDHDEHGGFYSLEEIEPTFIGSKECMNLITNSEM